MKTEASKLIKFQLVELYRSQIVPATIDNPAYYRVSLVANRLLQANRDLPQIHNKEWTITVVKEDNLQNAMVLPVSTLMVNVMTNHLFT